MTTAPVFISYRRKDGSDSIHLREIVERHFGKGSVFRDIESLTPGVDFRAELKEGLEGCKVVIALIGDHWEGAQPDGTRRIDNPQDTLRVEIETALALGKPIIPVWVGSKRLSGDDTNPLVQQLRRNTVIELRNDIGRDAHIAHLIKALTKWVPPRKSSRIVIAGAGIALALTATIVAIYVGKTGNSTAWRTSAGSSGVGNRVELSHPPTWTPASLSSSASGAMVSYGGVNVAVDPGALALRLPADSGVVVFGFDSAATADTSAEAFAASWAAQRAPTLRTTAISQASPQAFEVLFDDAGNGTTRVVGYLHLSITASGARPLYLWKFFLGPSKPSASSVRIAVDSLRPVKRAS